MKEELMGMSNEELIQQLYIKVPISEEDARALFPIMELYCAQQPIALGNLVEQVQVQLRDGIPWTTIRRSLVGRGR